MNGRRRDVVVVGGGHNGLVAAGYLARAGLDTLLLEGAESVGGAVASGEVTRPGFVHDLYATNMNLFLGSAAFAELGGDLARHGLEFETTSRPYSSAFPDGGVLRVYQDPARTGSLLAEHSAGDAEGWDRLGDAYGRFAPTLFELYGSALSLDALGPLLTALRSGGPGGLAELARLVLSSTRELGDAYFATSEAKALVAAWGMHLDFGPDVAMGALFPFLECFTDMQNGMSVVRGGAGRLADALSALVRDAGGEVRTGAPVRRILVEGGGASGVELASGERIEARRAVVANLTPRVLLELVPVAAVSGSLRRGLSRFRYGPATMVVHLALDGPIPWRAGEDLSQFGYVHIGPFVEDMARTYTEAENGELPASPFLVVGQTSAIDRSRAPEGKGVVWIQVRALPPVIRGDAAGEIAARDWASAKEPFAERVLAKLEQYAPGVRERILERAVLGPDDLERHNPNLVGGDSLGGSHHLAQNALLRPAPGWSRYRTPLERLYVVGSATWPGAGVNAVSGRAVARMLTEPPSRRERAEAAVSTLAAAARTGWATARRRYRGH